MTRVECPHCATSYTIDRLGLAMYVDRPVRLTVRCVVCGQDFDAHYTIETTVARPWKRFWRKTVTKQPVVVTRKR